MDKNEKRYIRVRGQKVEVDITIYQEYNKLRNKQCRRDALYRATTEELTEEECLNPNALDDEIERRLLAEQLHIALQKLTREEYSLIRELFYWDTSERDLAESLGVSCSTVHKRKAQILKKLRKLLKISDLW
ncbi:MAG: sigma factor-like helix-turn-helix DNA-binding protein [Oscillospiraceae bacterium]|nr:sigma factor-like helix-turn-helix DNA-binding protein [Oscillospiraceae bacterium]